MSARDDLDAPPVSPAHRLLRRLAGEPTADPAGALAGARAPDTELEDFRPLGESLEWRLADVYWSSAGALPFVRNDVPYLVNNSGRLSESAAELVLAAWCARAAALPARLVVLELGAGTGLFARYFLDAFAAGCRREGRDFYQRLTYVVSDRFAATVDGWRAADLFAGHEAHVERRVCDAAAPVALPARPEVVFCNYVLDVLPPVIARRSAGALEQLCVRTHWSPASAAGAGAPSLAQARAWRASAAPEDLARLLPLLPQLTFETAYRPWTPSSPAEQTLAALIPEGQRAIVNGAALTSLGELSRALAHDGFVLINDYGPARAEDVADHLGVQRFGGSVALGLNFPLLTRALAAHGLTVLAPPGDDQRRLRTRLVARRPDAAVEAALARFFSAEADRFRDEPQEEARRHVAAGRTDAAIAAYRTMVERSPSDWQLLGEAAEYIGLQLRDHAAGLSLARAALERNPWFSPWLWNILGDCFYYRERLDDAHAAFEQAVRIDPDDPRSNLNLAYTLSARGDQAAALSAIARGLAHDARGVYRQRLLEKQSHVLALIAERAAGEQERLARRAERFR